MPWLFIVTTQWAHNETQCLLCRGETRLLWADPFSLIALQIAPRIPSIKAI